MVKDFRYYQRQCYRKAKYSTEKLAQKVANKIKWDRDVEVHVYGCTRCGGYHLTKNKGAKGMVF